MARVIWISGEREVGSTPFERVSDAKRHAQEHYPIKAGSMNVTRVEVRDEKGALVFQHPRTVSKAP